LSPFGYSRLKVREFTGLSTFQILAYFRRAIVYTFLSIYLRSLGLSTTEVTLMGTVGMIANASTQSFLWGTLLDKYRRPREFVAFGEFFAGVGHFFMVMGYVFFLGLSQPIVAGYVIILSLGGIEVFWSMSNVGWSALVSKLTDIDERKKLMGQFSTIGGFGGIGGALLGGYLYDLGGFADGTIFIIAAGIMIFSSVIVYLTVRNRDERGIDLCEEDPKEMPSLSRIPHQLRTGYLLLIVALMFINFGRNSISIITSLFLEDPTGFGASGVDIALYSNVRSIANMIAGLMVGSVVAKSDDNKAMMAGTITSILGIVWLTMAPTFTWALIASFLRGASEVIIAAASYSIVARMAPVEYRGRLFAYYNATFFLSWGIAATLIAGPVADILIALGASNADAYRGSFLTAVVLVSIGVAMLLFAFRYARQNGLSHSDEQSSVVLSE
jgi:PPP family 3-phenylpropionic acid transporter